MSFILEQGTTPPGTNVKTWGLPFKPIVSLWVPGTGVDREYTFSEFCSLILDEVRNARSPHTVVFGEMELSRADFIFTVEYFMTNTDIMDKDPRLDLYDQALKIPQSGWQGLLDLLKGLKVGPGWNENGPERFYGPKE